MAAIRPPAYSAGALDDVDLTGIGVGGVLHWNGTNFVDLEAGDEGKVLTAHGAGAPTWETPALGITDHGGLSGLEDDDHQNVVWLEAGAAGAGVDDINARNHSLLGYASGEGGIGSADDKNRWMSFTAQTFTSNAQILQVGGSSLLYSNFSGFSFGLRYDTSFGSGFAGVANAHYGALAGGCIVGQRGGGVFTDDWSRAVQIKGQNAAYARLKLVSEPLQTGNILEATESDATTVLSAIGPNGEFLFPEGDETAPGLAVRAYPDNGFYSFDSGRGIGMALDGAPAGIWYDGGTYSTQNNDIVMGVGGMWFSQGWKGIFNDASGMVLKMNSDIARVGFSSFSIFSGKDFSVGGGSTTLVQDDNAAVVLTVTGAGLPTQDLQRWNDGAADLAMVSSDGRFITTANGDVSNPAIQIGTGTKGIWGYSDNQIILGSGGSTYLATGNGKIIPYLPIRSLDGSAAAPTYSYNSDTDSGWYRDAATGDQRLSHGATDKLWIEDSTGYVRVSSHITAPYGVQIGTAAYNGLAASSFNYVSLRSGNADFIHGGGSGVIDGPTCETIGGAAGDVLVLQLDTLHTGLALNVKDDLGATLASIDNNGWIYGAFITPNGTAMGMWHGGSNILHIGWNKSTPAITMDNIQRLGFHGAARVYQGAALTASDTNTPNSGDATTDAIIANLQTRVDELEDRLSEAAGGNGLIA